MSGLDRLAAVSASLLSQSQGSRKLFGIIKGVLEKELDDSYSYNEINKMANDIVKKVMRNDRLTVSLKETTKPYREHG